MNPTWQALAREAATAAEPMAIGVTALGREGFTGLELHGPPAPPR